MSFLFQEIPLNYASSLNLFLLCIEMDYNDSLLVSLLFVIIYSGEK